MYELICDDINDILILVLEMCDYFLLSDFRWASPLKLEKIHDTTESHPLCSAIYLDRHVQKSFKVRNGQSRLLI